MRVSRWTLGIAALSLGDLLLTVALLGAGRGAVVEGNPLWAALAARSVPLFALAKAAVTGGALGVLEAARARPRSDRAARPHSDRAARPRTDRAARPRSDRAARPRSDRAAGTAFARSPRAAFGTAGDERPLRLCFWLYAALYLGGVLWLNRP